MEEDNTQPTEPKEPVKIQVSDASEPTAIDAGVPEGEEVITQSGEATGEKVVYEKDKDGNVTGWHKEAING